MARSVEPEAAIGGYAIAMGVMGLVALPQMRIQQLTLVFLDDQGSLSRLRPVRRALRAAQRPRGRRRGALHQCSTCCWTA